MKLLTHNMLRCNAKGVKIGFPLKIEASKTEVRETEVSPEFLKSVVGKLDWAALCGGAKDLGLEGLPAEAPTPEQLENEEFLAAFHNILLQVVVVEGALVCPESGRRFPISNSIPNMILNEDEL